MNTVEKYRFLYNLKFVSFLECLWRSFLLQKGLKEQNQFK